MAHRPALSWIGQTPHPSQLRGGSWGVHGSFRIGSVLQCRSRWVQVSAQLLKAMQMLGWGGVQRVLRRTPRIGQQGEVRRAGAPFISRGVAISPQADPDPAPAPLPCVTSSSGRSSGDICSRLCPAAGATWAEGQGGRTVCTAPCTLRHGVHMSSALVQYTAQTVAVYQDECETGIEGFVV